MGDLISRQAAIENSFEVYTKEYGWCEMVGVDAINSLPPAQPEPKWIPCSERLPKKSGEYIVSGRWASGKVSVGSCEYSKEDGYFQAAWTFDVLAWMPLPEPYRQEGDRDNVHKPD